MWRLKMFQISFNITKRLVWGPRKFDSGYYDFWRGLSREECIDQLISTFGNEVPSYATVKRWCDEFNRGRHSLTDKFRKGCPKSVVGSENINAVQKLIMQDRHVTYCEIVLSAILFFQCKRILFVISVDHSCLSEV